jgi:TusA-related sulfurtransferase
MRELEGGQRLEVTSDDATAPDAIASWARLTGNPLLETIDEGGRWRFVLQRKQPNETTRC